jgi:hypothetical protein
MPLGYDREKNVVSLGDTADLYAYLYDDADTPVDPDEIMQVEFTVVKPDNTKEVFEGEITEDGAGRLIYLTDEVGEFRVIAQFTYLDGRKQSTRSDFEVQDPFAAVAPTDWDTLSEDQKYLAMQDIVAERVWDRLEDLFDAEDGGPWMRDMTMNVFGPNKVRDFIDEALFDINVYNPQTDFGLDKFALPHQNKPNSNLVLAVQGTLVAVIRHLMRSYAEMPNPNGGSITFEDRRDYLQRWGTIYQIEFGHYDHLVKMWKRQFLSLGQTKVLVSNKAGRLLPAPLRSRNIGRGYY